MNYNPEGIPIAIIPRDLRVNDPSDDDVEKATKILEEAGFSVRWSPVERPMGILVTFRGRDYRGFKGVEELLQMWAIHRAHSSPSC